MLPSHPTTGIHASRFWLAILLLAVLLTGIAATAAGTAAETAYAASPASLAGPSGSSLGGGPFWAAQQLDGAQPFATLDAPALEPPVSPAPVQPPAKSSSGLRVLGFYDQNWAGDLDAWESLSAHAEQMDAISPYWLTVDESGAIATRGWEWERVAEANRSAGTQVMVLVTNRGGNNEVLLDEDARLRAAAAIADAVQDNSFDGAVLDFESLTPGVRDQLTALVSDLAGRLHAQGKLLAVSVGPKWSSDESLNEWAIAYDYEALGQLADYVQIMSYDQHTTASEAGPIAALPWVEEVTRHAVTQIPPRKILLGLAAYGYVWPKHDPWGTVHARDAVDFAATNGAGVTWDEDAQEARFSYLDENGVQHQVWYENSYAIEQKIALAQRFGLGGVALWRLGQEDERLWSVLERQ